MVSSPLAGYLCLVNRLTVLLGDPFSWPVSRDHYKGCVAEVCFSNSRSEVINRGAARTIDDYWLPERLRHAEGDKTSTSFIAEGADGNAGMTRERQG